MFEIKNVTKVFKSEKALSNVSFKINGGMNFIIGASGSGKTTLLHILSGMDKEYEGDTFYNGNSIKKISQKEKIRYYGSEFGFITQSFNLIEELTVQENILLPCYLNDENSHEQLEVLLKKLKIKSISNQKVNTLSGGQKQRVAIARELMKNPKVVIADEPTAALDGKMAKEIIDILFEISTEKTVIVVTHDTSLIRESASVFELDKGILVKSDIKDIKDIKEKEIRHLALSLKNTVKIVKINFKRHLTKFISLILATIVAVSCLAVSFVSMFLNSSDKSFKELIENQGNSVLNLDIVSSFMSAGGMGTKDTQEQSIEQEISGLFDKYKSDDRVANLIPNTSLFDIVINIDGKDFIIEKSGQVPVFNKMIAGKNVDNGKKEVVLPKALVKKLGYTYESLLDKEVSFLGEIYNWDTGEPIKKEVKFNAVVSGIADTSYSIDIDGEKFSFEDEDSIFFSSDIIKDINIQAQIENSNISFTIQANSPEDFISLYDEIMAEGIVPLGQVELIRDIVSLKRDTNVQTRLSYTVITILSLLTVLSICLVLVYMRKKEYAIYKLSGYTDGSLSKIIILEYGVTFLVSFALSAIVCGVLGISMIACMVINLLVTTLCSIANTLTAVNINEIIVLKTGER